MEVIAPLKGRHALSSYRFDKAVKMGGKPTCSPLQEELEDLDVRPVKVRDARDEGINFIARDYKNERGRKPCNK